MVIAHFSKRKSYTYAFGFLVACGLMCGITLYHPEGVTLMQYMISKGLFRYELAIVCWICSAVLVLRQITILKQLILHKSNAVWTANRRLFYLNIYSGVLYRSVALSDIVDFKLKEGLAARAGIAVRLRDGRQVVVSTWLLDEPADIIIRRMMSSQSAP